MIIAVLYVLGGAGLLTAWIWLVKCHPLFQLVKQWNDQHALVEAEVLTKYPSEIASHYRLRRWRKPGSDGMFGKYHPEFADIKQEVKKNMPPQSASSAPLVKQLIVRGLYWLLLIGGAGMLTVGILNFIAVAIDG